jgi:hypothetical protein
MISAEDKATWPRRVSATCDHNMRLQQEEQGLPYCLNALGIEFYIVNGSDYRWSNV